jgi:hypothetical protein
VTIYYSPEIMAWLENGRRTPIPQNAMIIKEMYQPPAAQYYKNQSVTFRTTDLIPDAEQQKLLQAWTIMIKDATVAKDGWFWGSVPVGKQAQEQAIRFDQNPFTTGPWTGFAQYCFRCHSSAAKEMTFSDLNNIEGYAGDPLTFLNDGSSWQQSPPLSPPASLPPQAVSFNPEFVQFFNAIAPLALRDVVPMPPVGYDTVVSKPTGPGQFLTANQCQPCHDGFAGSTGNNMYIPATDTPPPMNLAPFGEWSWSLMGLAGRDPVFYAQLESETILQPQHAPQVADLCLSCHAVMGQRQYHADTQGTRLFSEAFVYATPATDPANALYGALARNGVSCTVCHHIVDDGAKSIVPIQTGAFHLGSPDVIYGPYEDVITRPMQESLGLKPVYNAYIKESRLCGSCHTIFLPVFDAQGNKIKDAYEQTTYLEWLNSRFAQQGSEGRTCQACHMPDTYHTQKLAFQIAAIQDQNYPTSTHLAPIQDITVKKRQDFRRHTLQGINLFVLEMFRQFPTVLGVNLDDFFPGNSDGLANAIRSSDELAKQATATVAIAQVAVTEHALSATVTVTNRAGHKLPSGVGFRRAFLTFQVIEASTNTVLWASGRTNALGIIVDEQGRPLPSEFFQDVDGQQAYQPHHEVIQTQRQVQIYEEVTKDPQGRITTSFVARNDIIKDNRLLPQGWSTAGPQAQDTTPEGNACHDPDYPCTEGGHAGIATGMDTLTYEVPLPAGTDYDALRLEVTLYYQSIPPYYLQQRFTTQRGDQYAKDRKDTQRLYYLASTVEYDRTPVQGWKLSVASDCQRLSHAEEPTLTPCNQAGPTATLQKVTPQATRKRTH